MLQAPYSGLTVHSVAARACSPSSSFWGWQGLQAPAAGNAQPTDY